MTLVSRIAPCLLFAAQWPVSSAALDIVGWGDVLEPVPGDQNARVIRLRWGDIDPERGGEALHLAIDGAVIGARRLDPEHNISPEVRARGGVIVDASFGLAFDGDDETAWFPNAYICAQAIFFPCDEIYGRPGTVDVDLGGLYVVDRIRMVSGLNDPTHVVRDFRVHVAPEVPDGIDLPNQARPLRPVAVDVRDNRDTRRDVWIPGDSRVRLVQVVVGEYNASRTVPEIEIYVRGFLARSRYVSNIIDFAEPVVWGQLRWRGHRESGSQVSIQTRTGHTADTRAYWRFTGRSGEKERVTKTEYGQLRVGELAGTTLDRGNWTTWSAPYDFADSAGTPVVSAAPRRYLQLMVDFRPNGHEAVVGAVEVRASLPVATGLVGEIWPVQSMPGESTHFTYSIRPDIRVGDPGFDRLVLSSTSVLENVAAVRIGELPVDFQLESMEPHRADIAIPLLGPTDSGALVEVDFRARVLSYGSSFEARVYSSQRPNEVLQRVNPGDATDRFEGNRVHVATAVNGRFVSVRVASSVVTPNGDGINEQVCIDYQVLEVGEPVPVEVRIMDLTGRVVRILHTGSDGTGVYRQCWDGRDASGRHVPPGLYLYRVTVDVDGDDANEIGTLGVSY